LLQETKTLIH